MNIPQETHDWANFCGIETQLSESVPSTNDLAKEIALTPETQKSPLYLYLTSHQSQGRGRGDRTWEDTASGESLLSSWSFALDHPPQPIASPLVGLALWRACKSTWPSLNWSLKAPNDLYLEDKKIAGLLLESIQSGPHLRIIIGLGFNIFSSPESLPESTALAQHLTTPPHKSEWFQFLDRLLLEFQQSLSQCLTPELKDNPRTALQYALNLNPLLNEKVEAISPMGDITNRSQTIPWMEL